MSTRGVKFLFSVGEFVLCFEPDPTKARVLYDAKILDTTSSKDLSGTKIPAYHVHFLGWNNSWDRIVPETYVLKNTEEYRQLMKKLADTTKKYRINSARNRRIDRILRKAFRGRPPLFEEDGDSPYEDDDYISSESENEKTDEEEKKDEKESTELMEQIQNGSIQEPDNQSTDSSEDDGSNYSSKSEDKKRKVNVDIELPPLLKEELEKDYIAINKQNMVLNLPAQPNIISVLEEFVKSFCVNVLFNNSAKSSVLNKEGSTSVPVERNIPLCKEMVDGLRLCFDYTLPLILLYASERTQLDRLIMTQKQKSHSTNGPTINSPPPKKSPVKRKHNLRTSQTSSSNGNISPKIPKLSPEIFKDKIEFEVSEQEELAPRRLTRQSVIDNARKITDSKQAQCEHSAGSEETDKEEQKAEGTRKKETRSSRSRRLSSSHPMCSTTTVKSEPTDSGAEPHSSRDHEDAPPPLLVPNTITTQKPSDNASQGSKASSAASSESCKEDILDRILSWQLLPPEKLQANPTAPSLLYGAHHLLRLFVKLPDLITSMNMEDHKVKALLSLIHCFLDYLMERREELFKDSRYVHKSDE